MLFLSFLQKMVKECFVIIDSLKRCHHTSDKVAKTHTKRLFCSVWRFCVRAEALIVSASHGNVYEPKRQYFRKTDLTAIVDITWHSFHMGSIAENLFQYPIKFELSDLARWRDNQRNDAKFTNFGLFGFLVNNRLGL